MQTKTIELILKFGRKMGAPDRLVAEFIAEELQASDDELVDVIANGLDKDKKPKDKKSKDKSKNPLVAMDLGMTVEKVQKVLRDCHIRPGTKITSFGLIDHVLGSVPENSGKRRACTNFLVRMPGISYAKTNTGENKTRRTAWGISALLEIGDMALSHHTPSDSERHAEELDV